MTTIVCNSWRASVASETLTGVTQLKIGDVCLLASERSERDTYRGKNEKIGDVYWRASVASETLTGGKMKKSGMFIYLFIYLCLDVCMSFCTLTLRIIVFAPRSTPSQTSLNRILRFSDHYPYHLRN